MAVKSQEESNRSAECVDGREGISQQLVCPLLIFQGART